MHNSNILIYQTEDGQIKIQTRLEDEIVWLTQEQLCELFEKSKSTIIGYMKNISMMKFDINITLKCIMINWSEAKTIKKLQGIKMSKHPIDQKYLKKIVNTTQSIEGYGTASKDVIKKVKSLRKKYGIKVSIKR